MAYDPQQEYDTQYGGTGVGRFGRGLEQTVPVLGGLGQIIQAIAGALQPKEQQFQQQRATQAQQDVLDQRAFLQNRLADAQTNTALNKEKLSEITDPMTKALESAHKGDVAIETAAQQLGKPLGATSISEADMRSLPWTKGLDLNTLPHRTLPGTPDRPAPGSAALDQFVGSLQPLPPEPNSRDILTNALHSESAQPGRLPFNDVIPGTIPQIVFDRPTQATAIDRGIAAIEQANGVKLNDAQRAKAVNILSGLQDKDRTYANRQPTRTTVGLQQAQQVYDAVLANGGTEDDASAEFKKTFQEYNFTPQQNQPKPEAVNPLVLKRYESALKTKETIESKIPALQDTNALAQANATIAAVEKLHGGAPTDTGGDGGDGGTAPVVDKSGLPSDYVKKLLIQVGKKQLTPEVLAGSLGNLTNEEASAAKAMQAKGATRDQIALELHKRRSQQ